MKNYLILAFIITSSLAACKKESIDNTKSSSTVSDSVASTREDNDDTLTSHSVSYAMKNMMKNMHQLEKTANIDYDLAMNLKEHHKGAIDMAAAEINSGINQKLKTMAGKMKEAQQKEIDNLDKLLSKFNGGSKNYEPAKTDAGLGKAMMDNMMEMMRVPKATGLADKDFAIMMTKHHNDGIKMGETILQYSKNADFRAMSKKMITDQKKDIADLEKWLSENK